MMNTNIMQFDKDKRDTEIKHLNDKVRADLQDFYNTSPYTLMHIAKSSPYLKYDDLDSFILEEKELGLLELEEIEKFMNEH